MIRYSRLLTLFRCTVKEWRNYLVGDFWKELHLMQVQSCHRSSVIVDSRLTLIRCHTDVLFPFARIFFLSMLIVSLPSPDNKKLISMFAWTSNIVLETSVAFKEKRRRSAVARLIVFLPTPATCWRGSMAPSSEN